MIDLKLLNLPFSNCHKIYDKKYRGYHRVKYLTDVDTEFGTLGFMVSRKSKFIILHVFFDGYYLRYPKRTESYSEFNRFLKHALDKWYKKYIKKLMDHSREKMFPFEYFHAMDKVLFTSSIGKRNTKRTMQHYILSKHNDSKLIFYDCINQLVNKHSDIVDTIEPLIKNMRYWIDRFPYDYEYIPKLNLQEYCIKPTGYGYVKRMPFDKFCEILKDWTTDEVMEMIGRYRHLKLDEYKKDPRRVLWNIVQAKITNFQEQL